MGVLKKVVGDEVYAQVEGENAPVNAKVKTKTPHETPHEEAETRNI